MSAIDFQALSHLLIKWVINYHFVDVVLNEVLDYCVLTGSTAVLNNNI